MARPVIRGCPRADAEADAENHVGSRSGVKSFCAISGRTEYGYQANEKKGGLVERPPLGTSGCVERPRLRSRGWS